MAAAGGVPFKWTNGTNFQKQLLQSTFDVSDVKWVEGREVEVRGKQTGKS